MATDADIQRVKSKQEIEQELISIILKLDGCRGDITHAYDEIAEAEFRIEKLENERDHLIGRWYIAKRK